MSITRVIRNVASNYVAYALSLAIAFVLTPILFHRLGKQDFALFVLVHAVYTILASLDLGLTVALIQSVSGARERQETEAIQQTVSTVFFSLGALGILISVTLMAASHLTAALFDLPPADAAVAANALGLAGLGLGFELAAFVVASYLQANHEFHLQNVAETGVRVLRAAAMIFLAVQGYGVVAIVCVLPVVGVLRLLANLGMARFSDHPFSPDPRKVRFASLKRLGRFSLLSFLDVNVYHVLLQADVLLAARVLTFPQLALIGAVRPFTGILPQMSRQATAVAYPMVVATEAREQPEARGRFLIAGTRNWMLVSCTLAIVLWVWAAPLLALWLGAEMREGATVLRVLLLAGMAAGFFYLPWTLLYGMGRVGYCAAVTLLTTAVGIVAGAGGGLWFGTAGLAAGLLAAQMLGTTLLYGGALHWGKIPPVRVFKGALAPCLLPLAAAAAVSVGAFQVLSHDWGGLIASALLAGGISMALFLAQMKSPGRSWRTTIDAIILRD